MIAAFALAFCLGAVVRPTPPTFFAQPVRVVAETTTTTTLPPGPPPAPRELTGPFTVAKPIGRAVTVFTAPDGPALKTVTNPTDDAVALDFLVRSGSDDGRWLDVYLPSRPNSSTGFIRAADVTLTTVTTQVRIELGGRRLTAWDGDTQIFQQTVAVGKAASPTPTGTFFLEQAVPMNPRSAYGPFILAISAHSDVYQHFGGGNGLVGIHGTNDPANIGNPVSHGCVRMNNTAIVQLAGLLSPGTPVLIVP